MEKKPNRPNPEKKKKDILSPEEQKVASEILKNLNPEVQAFMHVMSRIHSALERSPSQSINSTKAFLEPKVLKLYVEEMEKEMKNPSSKLSPQEREIVNGLLMEAQIYLAGQ